MKLRLPRFRIPIGGHIDPVCGMAVKTRKDGLESDGYWFCSKHCFDEYSSKKNK